MEKKLEEAYLAAGCFWCTEAIFRRLNGVVSVVSGYAGGQMEKPSYEQVSSETTGHAETVKIIFDPTVISFAKILEVFWATHNPTTLNRQGNDTGPQYRSVIFYVDSRQKDEAFISKRKLEEKKVYADWIVTEIVPFSSFYPAEEYHQNYYEKNTPYPYCSLVIRPKISKLLQKYGREVKEEYKEQE